VELGTAERQGVVASSQAAQRDPPPRSRWLRGRGTTPESAPVGVGESPATSGRRRLPAAPAAMTAAGESLGGWSLLLTREGLVQLPLQVGYLILVHRSRLGQQRLELLRPDHGHVVHGERAADQWPVRVDETQHTPHRNLRLVDQGRTDQGDLLVHPLHQRRAVSSCDIQQLCPRPEQTTLDAEYGSGVAVTLGINDEDPRRAHDQV
jgi:hypothetical protein